MLIIDCQLSQALIDKECQNVNTYTYMYVHYTL